MAHHLREQWAAPVLPPSTALMLIETHHLPVSGQTLYDVYLPWKNTNKYLKLSLLCPSYLRSSLFDFWATIRGSYNPESCLWKSVAVLGNGMCERAGWCVHSLSHSRTIKQGWTCFSFKHPPTHYTKYSSCWTNSFSNSVTTGSMHTNTQMALSVASANTIRLWSVRILFLLSFHYLFYLQLHY